MTAASRPVVIHMDAGRVLRVVDALDRWKAAWVPALARLWPCPRCKAPVGAPCVTPSGEPYLLPVHRRALRRHGTDAHLPEYARRPVHHAPRTDQGCRAYNSAIVRAWRADLLAGTPPSIVMREIERSHLYQRLRDLGLLGTHPDHWTRGEARA
jgi:hypothetical protein